ncbi:hypothetical protein SDC9_205811 [bioreactor metagenome]|uniref:Uncharacterized protein n=1 Tax=bioreactor metagenome TaxID=1076179 RepID=A0A645J4P6_9ZZZZ
MQQQECASAVGHVVRDGDFRSIGDVRIVRHCFRIQTKWRNISEADWSQVRLVVGIEIFKISYVLERIQVDIAIFQGHVGLDVVAELDDFQFDSFGFQTAGYIFPDFNFDFADYADFHCFSF